MAYSASIQRMTETGQRSLDAMAAESDVFYDFTPAGLRPDRQLALWVIESLQRRYVDGAHVDVRKVFRLEKEYVHVRHDSSVRRGQCFVCLGKARSVSRCCGKHVHRACLQTWIDAYDGNGCPHCRQPPW